MNEISISLMHPPLVRDIGHGMTVEGNIRHPDRTLDTFHVFLYVSHGSIQIFEDGIEYRLEQGNALFLKRGIPHFGGSPYDPGTTWSFIHFYDQTPSQSTDTTAEYSIYPPKYILPIETYAVHMTLPKFITVANPHIVELQIKNMLKTFETPHPLKPLKLTTLTLELFGDLYLGQADKRRETKTHRIVNRMIDLLREACPHKLTGQEIGDALAMNPAYLSSIFCKQTGKSVTQFQSELLIGTAIEMFRNTAKSISEVSDMLDFPNPFYFSRVFKKVTGISPSVFLNETYRQSDMGKPDQSSPEPLNT
ncbi:MAG: putative transcriptional regulator [Bacilli bacterium]|nr:putative transcriptional regulator [Bacilli bacterium]